MKTLKQFKEQSHIDPALVRAVVAQVGGWESFKEMAQDVANHGADSGFCGFTYYTDTCAFYARNQKAIVEFSKEMASQLGEEVVSMVSNFNCLRGSTTVDEVGQTLWGTKRAHDTQVANALAWFALEEVARSFSDLAGE